MKSKGYIPSFIGTILGATAGVLAVYALMQPQGLDFSTAGSGIEALFMAFIPLLIFIILALLAAALGGLIGCYTILKLGGYAKAGATAGYFFLLQIIIGVAFVFGGFLDFTGILLLARVSAPLLARFLAMRNYQKRADGKQKPAKKLQSEDRS